MTEAKLKDKKQAFLDRKMTEFERICPINELTNLFRKAIIESFEIK